MHRSPGHLPGRRRERPHAPSGSHPEGSTKRSVNWHILLFLDGIRTLYEDSLLPRLQPLQGERELALKATKSRGRVRLSRERIARAGLELADREGIDGLSMRRLAEKLGVGTMTLYGHFRDKRELLDAVNDAAVAEAKVPPLRGSWRQRIRQLVAHSRELFARHPCVVEIWASQPVLGTGALRWVEAGLETLEEAGFKPEDAVKAFRLLVVYTYGFTLFSRPRSNAAARESTRAALASLPDELYPRLREAAAPFAAAMASEEAFAYGLERILDGFEAKLP